jgi:hypothetical protein
VRNNREMKLEETVVRLVQNEDEGRKTKREEKGGQRILYMESVDGGLETFRGDRHALHPRASDASSKLYIPWSPAPLKPTISQQSPAPDHPIRFIFILTSCPPGTDSPNPFKECHRPVGMTLRSADFFSNYWHFILFKCLRRNGS